MQLPLHPCRRLQAAMARQQAALHEVPVWYRLRHRRTPELQTQKTEAVTLAPLPAVAAAPRLAALTQRQARVECSRRRQLARRLQRMGCLGLGAGLRRVVTHRSPAAPQMRRGTEPVRPRALCAPPNGALALGLQRALPYWLPCSWQSFARFLGS